MFLTNPRTGIQCHYLDEGEGAPPVICIHGWTGNTTRWEPTRKLLARSFRTIAYDLRGHGLSEKRPGMDFGFGAFVEDLLGLMDALKIEGTVLAGHSMGGMIAQHFALAHPERVVRLVLVGTAARPTTDSQSRRKILAGAWLFGHCFGPMMWLKDRKKAPRLFPDVADPALRPIPAAASRCLVSIAGMDLRAALKALKIPTLVVASVTDDTMPFPLSEELGACIPGAGFIAMSGCGHHIPIEQPEALASAIRDFLHAPG